MPDGDLTKLRGLDDRLRVLELEKERLQRRFYIALAEHKHATRDVYEWVYWEVAWVKVSQAQKALGLPASYKPDPKRYEVRCGACNATRVEEIGSRAALSDFLKRFDLILRGPYADEELNRQRHLALLRLRCGDCEQEEQDAREQRWEQFQAQKHADTQALRSMPYREYLQTDHWKSVRQSARRRAGNRCQVCNTNERALHVHHRTYERRGCEQPDDLTLLCDACHELFHEYGDLSGG